MFHNKMFNWFAVAVVLTLVFVIAFILSNGAPFKNLMAGIFLVTLYILLIASYLSRIAFVFFGVFAVYKVLQERANASNPPG